MRIEREAYLAELCHLVARRGTCSRAQVGAVIVRDGRIISTGYNGAPPGLPHCDEVNHGYNQGRAFISDHGKLPMPGDRSCRNAVHAEANAIAFAARNGVSVEGAELWCTHGPCLPCAQLMVSAGIASVRFFTSYRDPAGEILLESAGVDAVGIVFHDPKEE